MEELHHPKIYYHIETDKRDRFKNTIEEALQSIQYLYENGDTNIKLYREYEYTKDDIEEEFLFKIK